MTTSYGSGWRSLRSISSSAPSASNSALYMTPPQGFIALLAQRIEQCLPQLFRRYRLVEQRQAALVRLAQALGRGVAADQERGHRLADALAQAAHRFDAVLVLSQAEVGDDDVEAEVVALEQLLCFAAAARDGDAAAPGLEQR